MTSTVLRVVTNTKATFPTKLHNLLALATASNSKAIAWSKNGDAFTISVNHMKELEGYLGMFFNHRNLSSLLRQCNSWGIRHFDKGKFEGMYRNPDFHRDHEDKLSRMQRAKSQKVRATTTKKKKGSYKKRSTTTLSPRQGPARSAKKARVTPCEDPAKLQPLEVEKELSPHPVPFRGVGSVDPKKGITKPESRYATSTQSATSESEDDLWDWFVDLEDVLSSANINTTSAVPMPLAQHSHRGAGTQQQVLAQDYHQDAPLRRRPSADEFARVLSSLSPPRNSTVSSNFCFPPPALSTGRPSAEDFATVLGFSHASLPVSPQPIAKFLQKLEKEEARAVTPTSIDFSAGAVRMTVYPQKPTEDTMPVPMVAESNTCLFSPIDEKACKEHRFDQTAFGIIDTATDGYHLQSKDMLCSPMLTKGVKASQEMAQALTLQAATAQQQWPNVAYTHEQWQQQEWNSYYFDYYQPSQHPHGADAFQIGWS